MEHFAAGRKSDKTFRVLSTCIACFSAMVNKQNR